MASSGAVVIAACLLSSLAAAPSRAPAADAETDDLDEVVVEGSRNELNRLRDQVVRLEDRFYDRFNELNLVDDFDTYCHSEARVGTKIRRRYCRAVFQDKAYLTEGQLYTDFRFRSESNGMGPLDERPPPPAYVAIQARMEKYREHVRELVRRQPELIELLRKRHEAEKQYDDARRRIFGMAPAKAEPAAP